MSPPARGGILATAQALAKLRFGGTSIAAPLARLDQVGLARDATVVESDNRSSAEPQSCRTGGGQAGANAGPGLHPVTIRSRSENFVASVLAFR
jgi:hypothetical protein